MSILTKRKHTPIVSEAQRKFFGAELARKRSGKKTKTDMTEEELVRHLKEVKGKKLPKKVEKQERFSIKCPKCDKVSYFRRGKFNKYFCENCGAQYREAGEVYRKSLVKRINNFIKKQQKSGLIKAPVIVRRGGKSFTRHQWKRLYKGDIDHDKTKCR